MSLLPTPKSPTTSHILTTLILILSLIILILTVLLTTWATKDLQSYPTILVASSQSLSTTSRILAFPSRYNSYGLILNIIPGAGGTIDALLLSICFSSIDYIYLAGRTRLAKVSKEAARQNRAPTWLWGVTIFIVAFSVGRSLAGFVGSMVGYYTSARFTLPSGGLDGNGAYLAAEGRGFSVGGWTCQVKDFVVDGDRYKGKLGSLCAQEQAARWLTLPLLVCYSLLLWVVVLRFMGEKGRTRNAGVEGKRVGYVSESE